jgi:sarcosine oxidase subunit gamma
MADLDVPLRRSGPLAGRALLSVALAPPATRLNVRGSETVAALCANAFGCALPLEPCRAARGEDRAALWLGPDEWLLLAPEGALDTIMAAIAEALGSEPHSLVDISHRQAGFEIAGPAVEMVLNAGCPLDLSLRRFPVDMATRTLLGKAEIALWRRGPQAFRLEVNRSFAPYVQAFLRAAEASAA